MRQFLCVWLAALACAGQSVEVRYRLTPREVVESRVRMALKSNVERGEKLRALLEEAGCPSNGLTRQPVKHVKAPNVICTLTGETARTIVVGAHFDHAEAGLGVIDNWSGASLLPSLLECVRSAPRRHTFVFVGFTGEEDGLLGSRYYVTALSPDNLRQIAAMINFDSIGAGPPEVEVNKADKELLTRLLNTANSIKVPVRRMDFGDIATSDYESFRAKRVPTLVLHSITPETLKLLHSPDDNMKALRMDDYYDTYRLLAFYLALLDVMLDAPAKQ
ncbi:MAG TPA: M28 family peptidase [Bryobacteraceae bacterium]|nr:M28 family peptidase [Bryobacteraceae bacterium]